MKTNWMTFENKEQATILTAMADKIISIFAEEVLSYREAVMVLEITQERLNDAIINDFKDRSMKARVNW